MAVWIRRTAMVLLSIVTLGAYVPFPEWSKNDEKDEKLPDKEPQTDLSDLVDDSEADLEEIWSVEESIEMLTGTAREQLYSKLGPKILTKVEEDVEEDILPQVEEVIASIYDAEDEGDLPSLAISEHPDTGYGEKIFHIYDAKDGEDVLRFHVRRDMKPKQGYYFNFHYHRADDGFETHHDIGSVYWDKNTPPKWMTH
ncbi:YpjP family protein [Alkalicoccus chagannorensis]|uniref:YpjP family protein n=1 Tax=Alkalicoccus chagannorensis TaxID=427072 RepID=UPI00041678F0|nr:YpjP family protein [Alkalicoccus chagannorensis]